MERALTALIKVKRKNSALLSFFHFRLDQLSFFIGSFFAVTGGSQRIDQFL
jgi:hypothetical protein